MSFQYPNHGARFTLRGLLLLVTLSAIGLAIWRRTQPTITAERVRTVLAQAYPSKSIRGEGELQLEPGTKIVELDLPALRQAAPDMRVYTTTFSTGHLCYPHAPLAIVAWAEFGKVKTAEHLSPTYKESPPELMRRFQGLSARSIPERKELANEIAQILATITYQGSLANVQFDGRAYQATLMHGDLTWGTIMVELDDRGVIRKASLGG